MYTQQDIEDLASTYCIEVTDPMLPTPAELLVNYANIDGYDGDYSCLFVKDGKLYENHCSHCSCYGCEDQWGPEETTLAAIALRPSGVRDTPIEEVTQLARAAGYTGD